jgi:hypothetical protein
MPIPPTPLSLGLAAPVESMGRRLGMLPTEGEPDRFAWCEYTGREGPALIHRRHVPDQIVGIRKLVVMAISDCVLPRTRRGQRVERKTIGTWRRPTVSAGVVAITGATTKKGAAAGAGSTSGDRSERAIALLYGINILDYAIEAPFEHHTVATWAVVVID